MPLHLHRILKPEGELGIWKIDEPISFFLNQLSLFPPEVEQVSRLKGRRQIEWLAVRYLLHQMSGRKFRSPCLKDEFGKPYLDKSLFDISISHSGQYAAVIAAPRPVGVDIQHIVAKIERIAYKYMREEEMSSLHADSKIEHLHVYWGAKEALYKAFGRRKLDFKSNIFIDPFRFSTDGGPISGRIVMEAYEAPYLLQYEQMEDYILVYALENGGDLRIV